MNITSRFQIFIASICLTVLNIALTSNATAQVISDFYWSNSYGRGVGTIPDLTCPSDKEGIAGLCYEPCKDGTKAEGTHCEDKGKGNKKDYERFGKGTAKKQVCQGEKEMDAGLCYQECRNGYNGVGPVCWGKTPNGYIKCGAGFAKNQSICATATTAMTTSTAVDLAFGMAAVSGVGSAPACAANKAKAVPAAQAKLGAKVVAEMLKNIFDVASVSYALAAAIDGPVRSLVEAQMTNNITPEKLKKITESLQSGIAQVQRSHAGKAWNSFEEAFAAKGAGSIGAQWADPFYAVRTITSFINTGISLGMMTQPCNPPVELANSMLSVVSAYTWPVYGQ